MMISSRLSRIFRVSRVHHLLLGFHGHDRIAPFIMGQPGDMHVVALTGGRHGRHTVWARLVELEAILAALGFGPGDRS